MKYNKFDEVPVEIQEFFYEEVVSEPTGTFNESEPDEEGNTYKIPVMHDVTYLREHVRGETKVMRDLDRLIALNKPMSVLVHSVKLYAKLLDGSGWMSLMSIWRIVIGLMILIQL